MKAWVRRYWLRLLGITLLLFLLSRVNLGEVAQIWRHIRLDWLAAAVALNLPQVGLKAYRWQRLLRAQHIHYPFAQATLSYFGSIFVGLLTPGRVGEFVKAFHISRDCNISLAQGLSSVLLDRLFDLYALFIIGGTALLALAPGGLGIVSLGGLALLLVLPLALFVNATTFAWFCKTGIKLGRLGGKTFSPSSWLWEVHTGIRQLPLREALIAGLLTLMAYSIFFSQCYLLAKALSMPAGFGTISFAVALGSLVTLLPISISGLGTREAAIVAYLGQAGVSEEIAISFSLLVFTTFYVAGGLMGALAWWIKPAPFKREETIKKNSA